MNKQLILRCKIVQNINHENLSELSKIHLAKIIANTLDLLSDELYDVNPYLNIFEQRKNKLNLIWTNIYQNYYVPDKDFYPTSDKQCVSFLTYINEKPDSSYLSYDDIQVKILVLEDFIELYSDYKNSIHLSSVNIDICKKYLTKWKNIFNKMKKT